MKLRLKQFPIMLVLKMPALRTIIKVIDAQKTKGDDEALLVGQIV